MIVTLLLSAANFASVASELSLCQPTLPVEPSYATSGSHRDWDMDELFVLRCEAVPTKRIQFGVKFAGSA